MFTYIKKAVAGAVLTLIIGQGALAADYALIVNAANPIEGSEAELKSQITRLFLKQQNDWPDGTSAVPLDRKADSAEHTAFLKGVLEMSETELDTHWLRLKQISGETPPREVGSDRILIRTVGKAEGAFGMVANDPAGFPPEIRVLFTVSD